ncbi:YiiX/YebB-like N1pC/P60 family cysteine hydrolase [Spirochaeta lutea]|uniref:Permuted papain-like amidase enzyme, YaeF/YiiX, C92 family n=1 Tax=Spirochaeta lutea TaxID=1480694 RepID=A0A098QTB2_9SPIO|nr:YiiX/YebB-like N1pC/P60 family cysteine hydrolase [Spirochaeta lutea]KGE70944.1 hypothetical protein DC28_13465 [Spirochaeta lutea]
MKKSLTRIPAIITGVLGLGFILAYLWMPRLLVAGVGWITKSLRGAPAQAEMQAAASPESSMATRGDVLHAYELDAIQPGDIVLRRGGGLMSSLIVEVLGGREGFSHGGMLMPDETGGWQVVHSVSQSISPRDGVQAQSLEDFLAASIPGSTAVVRLKAPGEIRSAMAARALALESERLPFDYSFELGGGELYCTELLWAVLPEEIRSQTTEYHQPGQIIRFESFLNPDFFQIIIDRRRQLAR